MRMRDVEVDGNVHRRVKAFVDNDVMGDADPALSPRPRHYLLFDSFPMTDSGKVKRAQVKEIAAKRLADGQPKC